MKNFSCLFVCLCLLKSSTFAQQQNPKTDSILVEYYQTQKYTEAAVYLKKAYPEPLTNFKIIAQLAYTSNMANKLPEAEAYYQRLYAADSTNLMVLFNMAGINSRRGNRPAAINFYKRILQIDSTNFIVYKQLALLSGVSGDIPDEMAYLQKANHINPEDPDVAFELAAQFIAFHLNETAEKVLDRALKADTGNLILLKGKAQACYAQAKFTETITICNKLLENFDQSSQVISYKGISEFNTKKYSDCIKTFHLLDSTKMHNETSYYYLGMSNKELKNDAKAIYYLQKAISEGISPNIDTYYSEIGDSYDRLHLPHKAIVAYRRGLTFGEKPMAYYALASIYDNNLKDTSEAIRYYKKYLMAKPPVEKQKSYIDFTSRRIVDLSR